MTQEDKDLLLKDLCARLPFGVEIICDASRISLTLSSHMLDEIIKDDNELEWKPYLRPLSSMTKEEREYVEGLSDFRATPSIVRQKVDFYLERHLDYRGLIEKGLALEAPEEMYK